MSGRVEGTSSMPDARAMSGAFTSFMRGLIDYAGLFPPAALALEPAIRNHARYRTGSDAWMLGRFIVPTGKLKELAAYRNELFIAGGKPLALSVLVGGGGTESGVLAKLGEDAGEISAFVAGNRQSAAVEALETRLPEETLAATSKERTAEFVDAAARALGAAGIGGGELFVEIGGPGSGDEEMLAAIGGVAEFTRGGASLVGRIGIKLRCGGTEARAVPSVERVAGVIAACRSHALPLKLTAGLHHPLRHRSSEIGAMSHGFLNVFGAGILAHARNLTDARIEACVSDETDSSFVFDGECFSWRDERVTAGEIAAARERFMNSFGSCSFDEPRDDLRRLGLLPSRRTDP